MAERGEVLDEVEEPGKAERVPIHAEPPLRALAPTPPAATDPLTQTFLFLQEQSKRDREEAERRHVEAMKRMQQQMTTVLAKIGTKEEELRAERTRADQALLKQQVKMSEAQQAQIAEQNKTQAKFYEDQITALKEQQ